MRKTIVKYMSALLVLWYSLSIIGFDVHSCNSTGEVYVASLAAGISCEDVHPEHSCKSHGGCCEHHKPATSGDHFDKSDCCTNDLQILELTGVYSSSQQRLSDDDHSIDHAFNVDLVAETIVPELQRPLLTYLKHPDSGVVMPDRQAFFSIWRV